MRTSKLVVAAALCAAAVALGASAQAVAGAAGSRTRVTYPTVATCQQLVKKELHTKGKMTIATDNPVYAPWFIGNTPSNGRGYESAVAYAIASTLGFKHSLVSWHTQPYATSTLPGAKPFDFDINEIAYAKRLTTAVTFSNAYFNLNQSIVALKGNRIVTKHAPAALKTYRYGAQAGSPGLSFITKSIKPTKAPTAYATLADAVVALQAKHIDAIVVDVPDGQYMAMSQLTGGVQVAQFKTTGSYYALVLQKANPLVACVDSALRALSKSGKLASLSTKWLAIYNKVPTIAP